MESRVAVIQIIMQGGWAPVLVGKLAAQAGWVQGQKGRDGDGVKSGRIAKSCNDLVLDGFANLVHRGCRTVDAADFADGCITGRSKVTT